MMKDLRSRLILGSLILAFITACVLSLSWHHEEAPVGLNMKAETKQLFSSDVIELTLTVENTGKSAVSDISAKIGLPEGLSFKTSSPSPERAFAGLQPGQSASLTVYLSHDGSPVILTAPEADGTENSRTIHDTARSLRIPALILLFISLAVFAWFVIPLRKIRIGAGLVLLTALIIGLLVPLLISNSVEKKREKSVQSVYSMVRSTENTDHMISASATYHLTAEEVSEPYEEYRIVFDMDGAAEHQALSVAPGALLSDRDIPEREGLSFAGWYLDAEHTQMFEFTHTPIDRDMVLYSRFVEASYGWDSDGDGISDDEERAHGSDAFSVDDTAKDTDNDGLPDYWETYFCHSDPDQPDTDGDGLKDSFEHLHSDTDPAKADTDAAGIRDDLRDDDKDGLTNAEEQAAGTEPYLLDTDGDGIPDGEEVHTAHTDPLRTDTDRDGAGDGWEMENGYDPLKKDEVFTVNISRRAAGGKLTAAVSLNYTGDPSSVSITEVQTEELLDTSIPGYMGGIFSFSAGMPVESASVSFTFEPSSVPADADPCIYRYNEDTRLLEEVPTEISGNTASSQVTQLSVYTLLDRKAQEEIWNEEIMNLNSDLYRTSVFDIAFVIDYSSSMNENDPDSLRLQIVRAFIEKLRDNQDQATVIQFAAKATTLVPLSSNKQTLLNAVDSITNASGEGCNDRDYGTNGSDGIHAALEQLDELEHGFKYIIFLTDGEDTDVSYDYDALIKDAVEHHVTIFSIGMGEADRDRLQHIAEATGGKFYFAESVDMDDTSKDSLMYAFHDIEISTIDLETDSNNDGISDYHTRMICEGRLRTGTGTQLFEGVSFEEVQANDDYDEDGLKNGEEAVVAFDVASQKTYLSMVSSPTRPDSDEDGIRDSADPVPLSAGMAGGVCGKLSLVTCYNNEDSGWTSGHVFFVFTSYIRQDLDLSGMNAGCSRKDRSKPWSLENIQLDPAPQAAYHLEPGDVVTFCAGDPMGNDHPSYNLEVYRLFLEDPALQSDFLHNTCLSLNVTPRELKLVTDYLSVSRNNDRASTHNYTETVCRAWNRIGAATVSPYDPDFAGGKIATPKGLRNNLKNMTSSAEDLVLEELLNGSHE